MLHQRFYRIDDRPTPSPTDSEIGPIVRILHPLEHPFDMRCRYRIADPVNQARQYDEGAGCAFECVVHARLPRHRATRAQIEADEVVGELVAPLFGQLHETNNGYRVILDDDAAFAYRLREF